jgi:hypothetical protein
VEVNESVYNGDDVVNAKDEGIENAGATELESSVQII